MDEKWICTVREWLGGLGIIMGVFTDLPKQILDSLPSSAGYGYIICCIGGLINGATE